MFTAALPPALTMPGSLWDNPATTPASSSLLHHSNRGHLRCQCSDLTHNHCYRIEYGCLKNPVTKGRPGRSQEPGGRQQLPQAGSGFLRERPCRAPHRGMLDETEHHHCLFDHNEERRIELVQLGQLQPLPH